MGAVVAVSAFDKALCVGLWWLFDSTELVDHLEAQALCGLCPAMLDCAAELDKARAASAAGDGPVGTWAGRLVGVPKAAERERLMREELIYDEAEAKAAHAAYNHGSRGTWAVVGHRVWDRRLRRSRRQAVA